MIRLGLSQRLLLSVGLPLLLELVLFFATYILLDQTQQSAELWQREAKIQANLNWVSNLVSTVCWCTQSNSDEAKKLCKQSEDQMPSEFAVLENLFHEDPNGLGLVHKMEGTVDRLLHAAHTVEKQGIADETTKQITQCWHEVNHFRLAILKQEQAYVASIESQLFSDRAGMKVKLKYGFFATMVIGFLIAVLLAVDTITRLETLFKNAKLLGTGQRPSIRIGGNDELYYIDNLLYTISQELEAALERERQHARTDQLSRLPNRLAFDEDAERLYTLAIRYGHRLSVMVLDIDHFKSVNDTYGHSAGDEVIKLVADKVRSILRKSDAAARWGGEEFVVLLPETDLPGCLILAEKLRASIESSSLTTDGKEIRATASFGCTQLEKGDTAVNNLFLRADQALYQAKHNGRNQVQSVSAPAPEV